MYSGVEIIEFSRPDESRKNLFVTGIPATLTEDDIVYQLHTIFEPYGLLYGVQVYPSQWKVKTETNSTTDSNLDTLSGFYAFVTFYSAMAATKAKEKINSTIMLGDCVCKVAFAKRKNVLKKPPLYFSRCYELLNHYLGFNSWSTSIKTMFEDKDCAIFTDQVHTVKFVCVVDLKVLDIKTDGIGVHSELTVKSDVLSRIQAVCKCKKLCYQRAVENAFSKVLLLVLDNGKAFVEIDTTKPDFHKERVPDECLIMVNNLDIEPKSEETIEIDAISRLSSSDIDAMNLQILQKLEGDI